MWWTLLIWAVMGLVMPYLWTAAVFGRAIMNGYDLDLFDKAVSTVLKEYDAETMAKYNKFERIVLTLVHNHLLWPYKLVWLTRDYMPAFDKRYEDLVHEVIENGEGA